MIQEVKLPKETVVLDSEKTYTGEPDPSDAEKAVRRAIGLPIKKQLVFYKDVRSADSVVNVSSYKLIEMYDILERWYTVEIQLESGSIERIHSSYLIEMQKPSFVADMISQIGSEL